MTLKRKSQRNNLEEIAREISRLRKVSDIRVDGDVILGSGIVEGVILPTLILGGARGFEISPPNKALRDKIEKLSDDEIWDLLCYCAAILIQEVVGGPRGLDRD